MTPPINLQPSSAWVVVRRGKGSLGDTSDNKGAMKALQKVLWWIFGLVVTVCLVLFVWSPVVPDFLTETRDVVQTGVVYLMGPVFFGAAIILGIGLGIASVFSFITEDIPFFLYKWNKEKSNFTIKRALRYAARHYGEWLKALGICAFYLGFMAVIIDKFIEYLYFVFDLSGTPPGFF